MPILSKTDLTQFPPRSPRVMLGGYVHLPRLIDKARAVLAEKAGEFHYNCPLDQHFFAFTGIEADAMLAAIKAASSDSEVLAWVRANTKRLPSEIAAWSLWLSQRGPSSVGGHEWIASVIKADAPTRDDIMTFFDLLDLDDYVSYGGKA